MGHKCTSSLALLLALQPALNVLDARADTRPVHPPQFVNEVDLPDGSLSVQFMAGGVLSTIRARPLVEVAAQLADDVARFNLGTQSVADVTDELIELVGLKYCVGKLFAFAKMSGNIPLLHSSARLEIYRRNCNASVFVLTRKEGAAALLVFIRRPEIPELRQQFRPHNGNRVVTILGVHSRDTPARWRKRADQLSRGWQAAEGSNSLKGMGK